MTIESAQIVYVFGPMATGKTFTGDYMQVVHGYHHVDGDIPFKYMTLVPGYREIMEMKVQGDPTPYYSEIARLTLDAAKDHDKVVLSHATFHNCDRDIVVQKLVEGGVSEDRITLLQLTIDPEVKFRAMYHRNVRMAEQAGMTVEDFLKVWQDFEGEMTEERFVSTLLKMEKESGNVFEVHPNAIMVDVSGRDVTHFDNVDAALGLTRPVDSTYESICDEVKPIDVARDEKVMASGFQEAIAELCAKANPSLAIDEEGEEEKKVEEMKKRRSSIVQCEMLMRDLSTRSIGSADEKTQMRRMSLIKTGKIIEIEE